MAAASIGIVGLLAASVGSPLLLNSVRKRQKEWNRRQQDATNLRVLEEGRNPNIDIVCVHGLGGDPLQTWRATSKDGDVNWLTDFLPNDVPQARIMTYGYSSVVHSSQYLTQQTLFSDSKDLLEAVWNKRQTGASDRPLIFICHSLGGIVVKSALIHSSTATVESSSHLRSIELSTAGVLFFGTPQSGDASHSWGRLVKNIVAKSPGKPERPLLDTIEEQCRFLELQMERFKSVERTVKTYAFCEGVGMESGRRKDKRLVVPLHCAKQLYQKDYFVMKEKDHFDMVKFQDSSEEGYKHVRDRIREWSTNDELKLVHVRWGSYRRRKVYDEKVVLQAAAATQRSLDAEFRRIMNDAKVRSLVKDAESFQESDDHKALEAAKLKYLEALRLSEKLFGPSDPPTLGLLSRIAQICLDHEDAKYHDIEDENSVILTHDDDLEEAQIIYQRLLVAFDELYGPWDHRTLRALRGAASAAEKRGRYQEAELYRRRSLLVEEKRFGEEHSTTTSSRAALAVVLDLQSRYNESEPLYRKVLEERERTLGISHPDTIKVIENLALSYRMQGQLSKSAKWYCVSMRRRLGSTTLLEDYGGFVQTVIKLCEVYEDDRKSRQANELRKTLDQLEPDQTYSEQKETLNALGSQIGGI